jgi:hypothetical protein
LYLITKYMNPGSSFIVKCISWLTNLVLTFVCTALIGISGWGQTTQTYTTTGTSSWTAPAGVTSVTLQAWGAGGAGGGSNINKKAGSGGGGGAYTLNNSVSVIPGNIYVNAITVGAGGTGSTGNNGTNGQASSVAFGTTVSANGGSFGWANSATPGSGGAAGTYSGGNGGSGLQNVNGPGGGGGSSAGTASNGNAGGYPAGGAAVTGGGAGGNGGSPQGVNGYAGLAPGGGGGGGGDLKGQAKTSGGNGAPGQVFISYYLLSATSASSVICTGSPSIVTVNADTTNLPVGTYTFTYDLSAPNASTNNSTTMTVSAAGTGTFSTIALNNSGTTTIMITSIASGIYKSGFTSSGEANNTAEIEVNLAHSLTGNFTYYNLSNTPLTSGITVALFQGGIQVGTDYMVTAGSYTFTGLCPGTYEIRVTSEESTEGSVNTIDAAQANFWPTALYEVEMVRFYAGDVTGSSFYINASDAQRIQANFTYGTGFDRPGWIFWKSGDSINTNGAIDSFPTISLGSADVNVNFYGLCTGDFNCSFKPGLTKSASSTLDLIYAGTRQVNSLQEFELPVKMVNTSYVGAVSLILNFPADIVEVQDVLMDGAGGQLDWAVFGNELRIGWNSQKPVYLTAEDDLLTLKLKTTEVFTTGNSIRLTLAPDPLNELADELYNVIGDAVLKADIIEANTIGTGEEPLLENLKLACYPNPFYGQTSIIYSLPSDGYINLEINSSLGNRVETLVDQRQLRGDYLVKFNTNKLAPGIYSVTLRLMYHGDVSVRTIKIVRAW